MLSTGTRLGPYEVLAPIGAGGMGEVYKARDTRLDRTVAIKVLPQNVALDTDLRQRFEREAKTLAALSHPHICPVFDVGRQDGVDFLVMEYLEGETLAHRLMKGGLPLDQALKYAIEIADALDKAHRQGIVHRDLKPGNIMITKQGAKLLDFGLAKLRPPVVGSALSALSAAPTEDSPATAQGTILGTLQYMAPEQLEGKDVDARTDIFTFGAVLYEMLTRRKAFEGKSQASLIHAIMGVDPAPISATQPMSPPGLDHVVRTCLAKDPDDRFHSAHDLQLHLQWAFSASAQMATNAPGTELATATTGPLRSGLGTRERFGWMILSMVLAAIAVSAVTISYFRTATSGDSPVQFAVLPPENTTFSGAGIATVVPQPSVSPDGHRLAFVAVGPGGTPSLWVRAFDSSIPQALPGTEDASDPFWSPDGRFIGFFAQGTLKQIGLSGGAPQTLADAGGVFHGGGTWNGDGVIVFAPNSTSPLYRVPATGGLPTPVTTLDSSQQETGHLWPHFLPDGRHFLYLVRSANQEHGGLFVGSIDSTETNRLVSVDSPAVYDPQGYLLFLAGTDLMAHPFDADRLEMTGAPVRVAERVQYNGARGGYGAFSVSRNNTLVYRTISVSRYQLVWLDRTGRQLGQIGAEANYTVPSLSPDESKVAVAITSDTGSNDIWVLDVIRNTSSRLTSGRTAVIPIWSPDGNYILYRSQQAGPGDLYQKRSSGAGTEEVLLKTNAVKNPTDWSADGRFVVYDALDPKTNFDVWVLPTTGDRKPFPLLQTEFNDQQGRVSPDGRWIAYTSDETGHPEVYVQSFPTPGGKWQISTSGGADPRWRRDGRELFFMSSDRKLMAVEVKADAVFQAGLPQELFEVRVSGLVDVRTHYAVTADGRRFLVNRLSEGDGASPITVVLNWTAALRK